MSKPTVVILAGGQSSRFFPFSFSTHKGGIALQGKTLLRHTLENLQKHGFENVIIVISPRDQESHTLQSDVQNAGLSLHISYVVQEEARGMGDAILLAHSSATPFGSDRLAIISAYQTQAAEILNQMLQKNVQNVVAATHTDRPWDYGILSIEDGFVTTITEKPERGTEASNQKVQTIYLLSNRLVEILRALPESTYNFEDALNILFKETQVAALQLNEALPSLKYPWDIFYFQKMFFAEQKSFIHKSAKIADTAVIDETKGTVYIDEGAVISHCARISGPTYIGKNAFVGDFSLIRESNLEEGVQVGVFSEIARSIFLPGSTIHSGYVGDSIIGEQVKIGAGFITANKRLDRQNIRVKVGEKLVNSERRALGVFIGEKTHVGIKTATMPGTCIGANSIIYPNLNISQNLPASSIAKTTTQSRK
jgi:bifunctional UDP-N-acetylglucosamine pyrophosphorylase/glucosamine-1-phosphate N-acetyltransferase